MSGKPRILFIDVESAPVMAAVFPPLHDTNVVWTERGTYLYGFAYQWMGEKEVTARFLPDYKRFKRDIHDDKSLCKELHALLSTCTQAIGHNAQSFDVKLIRSRLIIHGCFDPLPPFRVSDTLKWARSIGRFDSNRLNALGEATGIGKKLPTKNDLWRRCYHGDRSAFESMRRYCAMDVTLLQRWYDRVSPWAPDHIAVPSHLQCTACQSSRLISRGSTVSQKRHYRRLQCGECGHWQQGELIREFDAGSTKKKSNHLLPSVRAAQSKQRTRNEANRSARSVSQRGKTRRS